MHRFQNVVTPEDNTRRVNAEECVSESQTRSRTVTVAGPGDFSPWIGEFEVPLNVL